MSSRKVITLAGVVVFGSCGDVMLSRGMKQVGEISLNHLSSLIGAIGNPWIIFGICLLIGFFVSYLTALSFADLTFVLPTTAVGYIFMALLARFFLHEHVSVQRWIGILLIVLGVGFVAGGPSRTDTRRSAPEPEQVAAGERA